MNVLVVSGLWPPDLGGPATHAPEVCDYLHEREHEVAVVTMADRTPERRAYPVYWISRRLPPGARHAAAARRVASQARRVDVVYSTGMVGRSSFGAAAAGKPIVLKLTADPAFERALRWGLCEPDLAAFQHARGARIAVLRRLRDRALARASRLVVPSESLRQLALGWGVAPDKVLLLPNPVEAPELEPREDLRRRHRFQGSTLVFAGRLVPQKSLDVSLEALRQLPDVTLVIAGEGPARGALERQARELGVDGRARFVGAQPRHGVFELLRAADAAVLSSSWENFPHVVVEALAVGTPVVATDAGGVTEIVGHEENGLLVPTGNPDALAAAIRRYLDDDGLRAQLRAHAADSVAGFAPQTIYARLEKVLCASAASA